MTVFEPEGTEGPLKWEEEEVIEVMKEETVEENEVKEMVGPN